jgi:energy-coupling factor transport system ATP-binding protein
LSVKHLAYAVGDKTILADIDFAVERRERLVILGSNGCGKTTLLRLIARLQKPTAGSIEHNLGPGLGQRANAAWHKAVGYVYQNPSYQLFMPQVLAEVDYQSPSRQHTQDILELFGLSAMSKLHSQTLSEGQKRRLSIAAIAAQNPQVLLLDEPTVGQDNAHLQLLINALNQLHQTRDLTLITVTHDHRAAIALGDRAIWIKDGRVQAQGGQALINDFFAS